jgi:hypothetical protein
MGSPLESRLSLSRAANPPIKSTLHLDWRRGPKDTGIPKRETVKAMQIYSAQDVREIGNRDIELRDQVDRSLLLYLVRPVV